MKRLLYFGLIAFVATACIKNDIPYPMIQANITSIVAESQSASAAIDSSNRVVTLFFPEDANIYAVKISSYSLTPDAFISSGSLDEPLDLSSDYELTVSLYQDYQWTISASQSIPRSFAVEGQIGTAVIDPVAHTVTASVNKHVDISKVSVTECKIAPSSASVSPDLSGKVVDFSSPVSVLVDNFGHKEEWTVTVSVSETVVETVSADGWTCVGWVYGEAQAGKSNGVQYRIKGDTEWINVPQSWISHDGGNFTARITGLSPSTRYETRAFSDSNFGEVLEFTTGEIVQMPNSDFENWWLDGKVWCPWEEGGTPYWGTGNKGAATLGQSNSVPTDDTVDGKGQAAKLETRFVGIGMLGKLAAGNIFAGSYVRTDGTNGVLSFGREFSQRPTRLTGYLKYQTAPISSTTAGYEDLKGRPDTCTVWIALIDLPEPLEIRTNPKDQQLFDPDASYVIAYGRLQSGSDISEYAPFDIELEYRSTSRIPTYILCAGSASKYGDFFTGGNGAVLYLDDLKLEYDY